MKKILVALSAVAVLMLLVGCGAGVSSSGLDGAVPATEPAKPAPVEAPAPQQPAEPALTTGQQQAVQKAKSYLDMGGFSRTGLIKQLAFGGFSEADATFAVDRIAPDWNAQAVQKAKSYMEMGGFSRAALIKQLTFGGFSEAEAEHGAKAVGY